MSFLQYLLLFSVVCFPIFGSSSVSGQNIGKFSSPLTFCEEVTFEKDLVTFVASDNNNNDFFLYSTTTDEIYRLSLPDNKILWKSDVTGKILYINLTQDGKILKAVTINSSSIIFTNFASDSGIPISQLSYSTNDFNFLYSKINGNFLIKSKKDPKFYIAGNEDLLNLELLSELNITSDYSLKFQIVGQDIFILDLENQIPNTISSKKLLEKTNQLSVKTNNKTGVSAFEINQKNIIFGFSDGDLMLINLQDKKTWSFKTGGKSRFVKILHNFILAISDDNFIYLFNKSSGRLIWKYRNNGRILTPPIILDENLIISDFFENTVKILDLQSGKLLNLIVFPPNKMPINKIIFKHNRLYFLSKKGFSIFSTSAGC